MRTFVLWITLVLAAVTGCAAASYRQAVEQFGADYNRHDVEALAAYYAEDAVINVSTGDKIKGRASIAAYFRDVFDRYPDAQVELESTSTESADDQSLLTVTVWRVTVGNARGTLHTTTRGRQVAGVWRIVESTWAPSKELLAGSRRPAATGTPAVAPPKLPAGDEARTALVIGNGAYHDGKLANPVSDARLVAEALRAVGFDVAAHFDADQAKMKRAIDDLGTRLGHGGVGLFYFSGHGMQVAGRNYLVPIGANIGREGDVDIETVDVARVLNAMDGAHNRLNLVVLDACRNNPFARSFRSASRGLAFVDAPQGSLIAYATAPGDVAEDGAGDNSPFSAALAKHVRTPGAKVEEVFKAVRRDVKAATQGRQTPWDASSLETDFYFVPPGR